MKSMLLLVALIAAVPAGAVNLVVNGSFETTTATDKSRFAGKVAGWSGGGGLDFIDFVGSADDPTKYLAVYGPFPSQSPAGGKFFEADGDHNYGTAIYQTVTGLVAGHVYNVKFWQAAGQQLGFTGPTTERWDVSLGNESHASATFHLPQGGVGPWQTQLLRFTATGTSEVLSFLATGTPAGKPPIVFLDGVSLSGTPEPATWALLCGGFGLTGAALRRRSAVAA